MKRRCLVGACLAALASLILAGCSGGESPPPVAKATGTVTYQGKPVAGATVTFIQDKAPRSGSGVTNAEGRFEISTFANNDGALVGDHAVTIVKNAATGAAATGPPSAEDAMKAMKGFHEKPVATQNEKASEIPAKYAAVATSQLKAIVSTDSAKNDFKFELVD